jgi:2-methylaconitate cis-trans-isomerase PrpF
MYDLNKIKCFIYRGGTSRGLFFHSADIPQDFEKKKQTFLGLMGSPDIRQIDGLGGATSHTSKVVIISKSDEDDIDIEYDFYQIGIDSSFVGASMCGNLLSAAGLFAVDEGLVEINEPLTVVRVRNTKSMKRYLVHIPVNDGRSITQGAHKIAGVARAGALILEEFLNPAGTFTGKFLPTGKPLDHISVEGVNYNISIIDIGNLVAFLHMEEVKIAGTEKVMELNNNQELLDHLEMIRGEAARLSGLVDSADQARTMSPSKPHLALVGYPLTYRTFYKEPIDPLDYNIRLCMLHMQRFHQSIALTASICVAGSTVVNDSIVNRIYRPGKSGTMINIGHPSGIIQVGIEFDHNESDQITHINKINTTRTARRLMEGYAYYPKI